MVRRALWLALLAATCATADPPLATRLVGSEGRWQQDQGVLRIPSPDQHAVSLDFALGLGGQPLTRMEQFGESAWYGSGWWSGPEWCRVGRDWQHPGQQTDSVRCWQAPRDGQVTVTGRARKLHLDGDGVRVSIRSNQRTVWQAELEGKDDQGVEPRLSLALRRGDQLRFIVSRRGSYVCDTTGWDPSITYADGQTFVASRAFGRTQEAEGWSYEVLGSADSAAAAPRLAGVGPDLVLRWADLSAGATAWPAESFLPAWLLALGDSSGLVVAAEPAQACTVQAELGDDGHLRLRVTAAARLDAVRLTSYTGARAAGLIRLADDLGPPARPALAQLTAGLRRPPELPLLLLAQAEWQRDDHLSSTVPDGWLRTHLLKRDRLLERALVDGQPLLFCRRAQPSYSHLVGQYFGWRQRPGGGLYALEEPGVSLRTRDVVGHQLPAGSYLEPSLSFDGRRIAFSFVAAPSRPLVSTELPVNEEGDDQGYFHLYEVGADGRDLRPLTDGAYDDLMPCWLPDGGLAFVSTRRRSYSRCFGPNFSRRWHSYTLHRLDPGGQPRLLSVNDVSEWFPALAGDGRLLFARWDYIDRDAVTHQNLWAVRPDGTNPVAIWGNATPKPHCTFQAKAIPGSHKLAFIASAHHAITGGPLCLLDPTVDANSQAAIRRLTPGPLPEAEPGAVTEYYNAPWPLAENLFLIAYSPEPLVFEGQHLTTPNPDHALGLYVLDASGQRELLYRDGLLGATNPMPLAPRPAPPLLAPAPASEPDMPGEMLVSNVYQGLGDLPRGSIKALRIVEILPKTSWLANEPRIGLAGEENARAILGTVPVEADGSARFRLPPLRPVLFQALDAQGRAYQTMRSTTYVQPGERTGCVGCHEPALSTAPAGRGQPLALRRPPSDIAPGELGGRPFVYAEVVQPVLDRHCVRCHGAAGSTTAPLLTGEAQDGLSRSYWSLCGEPSKGWVPRYPQRNQIQATLPGGQVGALGSGLLRLLAAGHHDVRLEPAEQARLAAWIDLNAVFRGDYGR